MSNEILEKLKNNQELTIEEISCVLPEIIHQARNILSYVNISDEKKCVEANQLMYLKICPNFNVEYLPLETRELGEDNLYHLFGIITFNSNSHPISFICDLTYNQFKVEPEYEGLFNEVDLNSDFSNNLINNGFVPFTQDNFNYYTSLFMQAKDIISIRQLEKERGRKLYSGEIQQVTSSNEIYRRKFVEYIIKELGSEKLQFNSNDEFNYNKSEVSDNIQNKR